MDLFSVFAISGSGMSVEKLRLDVTALNLANVNSTRAGAGTLYQPLTVISTAKAGAFANARASGAERGFALICTGESAKRKRIVRRRESRSASAAARSIR